MNYSAPIAWPFSVTPEPGDASLLVVGDTNVLGRDDAATAFARVQATFDSADGVIGQMEGMLTTPSDDPEAPDIPFKSWWRHSEMHVAKGLKAAGFSAVACASNVAYPGQACVDTATACRDAGLPMTGVGENEAEARAPAVFLLGATKIGLLSYTSVFHPNIMPAGPRRPGCATIRAHTGWTPGRRVLEMPGDKPEVSTWVDTDELMQFRSDVRAAKAQCDTLIVSCHWGISSSPETQDYQLEIARAAASEGVDLIFGHHPHVIQGAEFIGDMPVFYSLGNFAFDGHKMRNRHLDGLVLRLLVRSGRITDIAIVPARRGEENLVELLDPSVGHGASIMARLSELCANFGTRAQTRGADAALTGALA